MAFDISTVGFPDGPLDDSEARSLPPPPAKIHFIGIGGIGMSGIARSLILAGYDVSGSDAVQSEATRSLAELGVRISIGHTAVEWASDADALVVTRRAVQRTSPELEAALEHGVPIIRRGELVGSLFNARMGIAVAGSHGKSTTTGMLVWTLRALDQHPSFAIGATLPTTTSTVALDTGSTMVVEADEFDHQFLWLHPQVTVVTNVEFDHPDVFPTQEAYDDDFRRFVLNTKPAGTILLANDDPGSSRVRDTLTLPSSVTLQTFGEAEGADWLVTGEEGAWTVRTPNGKQIPLPLAVPGRHNARNATAALAALNALGLEPPEVAQKLETFPGVGRRFEILGTVRDIVVVDDYAHHPTEVRATIRAARGKYPDRRLLTVFQPHTFSRTLALLDEFASALGESDRVALLDIYGATETDDLGVSSQTLARLLSTPATTVGDPDSAVEHLAQIAEPGDVLLTLGAGTITSVGPRLLHRLSAVTANLTNSTATNQAVE